VKRRRLDADQSQSLQDRGLHDLDTEAPNTDKENLLMKRVVCLVTFLALSVAASHVHAQAVGDPQEGLKLAQQVCSECHAIRRGQVRSPNSRAPTFLELAAAPGMTIAALSRGK